MNKNDYNIRLERKEEYREVEELVRDSFWNVYRPGCLEHYVLHTLRDDPAFVPELDLIMEKEGRLIGQNVFVRTSIKADDGRDIPIMTMGLRCAADFTARRCSTIRLNLQRAWDAEPFALRAISDFTVRAGLLTLLSTAFAITDCLTVRTHRSFKRIYVKCKCKRKRASPRR